MNLYVCYTLLLVASALFAVQFFFNDLYEKNCGNTMFATLIFSIGYNTVGFVLALALNGFRLEITGFAVLMAFAVALNMTVLSFCSLRALSRINLSLYSIFMMIGGMVLPFIFGIFRGESFGYGKILCFAFIAVGMLFTREKDDKQHRKSDIFYYAAIFILNGLCGVLATVFTDGNTAAGAPVSAAGFAALYAGAATVLSLLFLPFFMRHRPSLGRLGWKPITAMLGYGTVNRIAEWLLLVSLANATAASAQYPLVTGGTMIFSTLLCYFTPKHPRRREWLAVGISVIGILFLFLEK